MFRNSTSSSFWRITIPISHFAVKSQLKAMLSGMFFAFITIQNLSYTFRILGHYLPLLECIGNSIAKNSQILLLLVVRCVLDYQWGSMSYVCTIHTLFCKDYFYNNYKLGIFQRKNIKRGTSKGVYFAASLLHFIIFIMSKKLAIVFPYHSV